jgi:hypothetical protein
MMTRLSTMTLALTIAAAGCTPGIQDLDPGNGGGKGDNGGDLGPDANCPSINFMATSVTPSVQLLIDRSGSMGSPLPGTALTAYQAMRQALVGMDGVVTKLQAKAHIGAALYTADATCPRLNSTPTRALNNLAQVTQLIDSQVPNGNTPTGEAIDQVVTMFQSSPPPTGSPPLIVLATDGLPGSCDGTDGQVKSIAAATNAYTKGIRTFVLGIAGVNDTFLQQVANAGQGLAPNGTVNAKFFTATSPQELQTAFLAVIGGAVSCEFKLSGTVNPDYAQTGVVTVNGKTLAYGQDWEVVNSTTIRLVGQACADLTSGTTVGVQVQASFPCGAVIL